MDLPSIQQLRNFVIYGKYGNFTTLPMPPTLPSRLSVRR